MISASSRERIFFFISCFLSFTFYANASIADLLRNWGRSGLNSAPYGKMRLLRRFDLTKNHPAAIGSRVKQILYDSFGSGDGGAREQRLAYLT